jgi:predicted CXXCH cytochrome family protein
MSEWCLNCHEKYDPKKHHPAGNEIKITPEIVKLYNLYLPGDNASSSYLTLVPFEVGSTDYAYLKELAANDDSQLGGPINANVSCLSCHRAHASGFMYMTRWQNESQFIIQDGMYPGSDNAQSAIARGHSAQETAAAYYNRNVTKFSSYQRSLCNKCHAKD